MPQKSLGFLGEELSQSILRPYTISRESLLEWTERSRRFNDELPHIIPPLKEIYKDEHPEIVILKAAQVFISEYLINSVLWVCDTAYASRGNALYVMPTQTPVMDDFSQSRISEAIVQSPTLGRRLSVDRIRLKKFGSHSLYMRGSEALGQMRTIDADIVINDEVDLFQPGSVEKTRERLGSSRAPLWRAASQPTYPEVGIDRMFQETDKRKWFVKCEHCTYSQSFTWDDNIIYNLNRSGEIDADTEVSLVCAKCRKPIDPESPGEWVAEQPSHSRVHGYHISKLFSPRANLVNMLKGFLAVDDVEKLQSFYTADLGIPYRPRGSKADITDFIRMVYPWKQFQKDSYIGIDVGINLHVCVVAREEDEPYRLVEQIYVPEFDDLDTIMDKYKPRFGVIDARGDPRATYEWAQKYPMQMFRWEHHPSRPEPSWEDKDQIVRFDRTAMLDQCYQWMRARPAGLILNEHISADFVAQITAPVRELIKNNEGRLVPRYVAERADHYAFALSYAIMAAAEFGGRIGSRIRMVTKEETFQSTGQSFRATPMRPRWTGSDRR